MKTPIEGVEHAHAPRVMPVKIVVLLGATLFAAGFTAALYTIGLIVTAR